MNNYKATLILSQAHARPNKKEILSTFVILSLLLLFLRL